MVGMTPEAADLGAGVSIPHDRSPILAAGQDAAPIGREGDAPDDSPMASQPANLPAGLDIPDTDRCVSAVLPCSEVSSAAGGVGQSPVARERHAEDPLAMTPEFADDIA